ncbi:MAG: hypothetical protein WAM39_27600 [Bryobacteraceae bacterium]
MTGYHSLLFWDERNGLGYRWTGPIGYACGASMCYWREFWATHNFSNMVPRGTEDRRDRDGRRPADARRRGANTSSAQRVGQNNWPLAGKVEFPRVFFETILQ